jgi:ABC-type dipeptide/oligopeptide/nickel transport system permease component
MTVLVFALVRVTGDPLDAMLPLEATQQDRRDMQARLGLDKPLAAQYLVFVSDLARADLGTSVEYRPKKVADLIQERWVATFQLALAGNLLAVIVAVPLGVFAARRRGTLADAGVRFVALLGQSLPVFVIGLLLIAVFANSLGWVPTSGMTSWESFVLPTVTMAVVIMPGIMRILRSSMIEALTSDYVAFGRAQGLTDRTVVWKYSLRNASIPAFTFAGLILLNSLAGAVVTETVFAWPGLGQLAVQAVTSRDYPVVQGVVLVVTAAYLLGNLLIDIAYGFLDPRVRYESNRT